MSGRLKLLRTLCSWKIGHQVAFFLFHSFLVTKGVAMKGQRGHVPSKFLAYLVTLCFDRQCLEQNPLVCLKSKYLIPPKFLRWLVTLPLVITFIQTACISLAANRVPQYQAFHTELSYLVFNLPLTKSSQQSKTARHCKNPMKSSIVILILRSKQ